MNRGMAATAIVDAVPALQKPVAKFYGQEAAHWWKDEDGVFHEVTSARGFDQGCPIAPAAFASGLRYTLDAHFWL
eukprot:4007600-Prorocentrum_lima.AAC.1